MRSVRRALAADERYCLSCGERRGPPRLDPLAHARGRRGRGGYGARAAGARCCRDGLAAALPARGRRRATLLMLAFGIAAGAAAGPTPGRHWRRPAGPRRSSSDRRPRPRRPSRSPLPSRRSRRRRHATADTSTPESTPPDSSAADAPRRTPRRPTPRRRTRRRTARPRPRRSPTTATRPRPTPSRRRPHRRPSSTSGSSPSPGTRWTRPSPDPSPMPYLAGTLRPKGMLLSGYKPALPGGVANLIALVSGQRPTRSSAATARPTWTSTCRPGRAACSPRTSRRCPASSRRPARHGAPTSRTPTPAQPPDTCRHPAPGGAARAGRWRATRTCSSTPSSTRRTAPPTRAGSSRLLPDTEDAESAPRCRSSIPNACHDGADQPCADGAPGGPGRGRRVAEGATRPAAGLQGLQGRRSGPAHLRHRPGRDQAGGRAAISDAVDAGATDDGDYRPANLLRTLEDGFTLDALGRAKHVHAVSITNAFTVRQRPRNE